MVSRSLLMAGCALVISAIADCSDEGTASHGSSDAVPEMDAGADAGELTGPCDDEEICTENDRYQGGVCIGEPRTSQPKVLGSFSGFGSAVSQDITVAAFPSEKRAVFVKSTGQGSVLTLARIEGGHLTVLDRRRSAVPTSMTAFSPWVWINRPMTFLVPLSESRIALVGEHDDGVGIDLFDIGQDLLAPLGRFGYTDSISIPDARGAAGMGRLLWTCDSFYRIQSFVIDSSDEISAGEKFDLPGDQYCTGLSLSPDGATLYAATTSGLYVLNVSSVDGSLSSRSTELSGQFVLDVSASRDYLSYFELVDIHAGVGSIRVLRTDTFAEVDAFLFDEMAPTNLGAAMVGKDLVLEHHDPEGGMVADLYAISDAGAAMLSSLPICSVCDDLLTPAPMAGTGGSAVLGSTGHVIAIDPATKAMTRVTGPEQGAALRVRASGPGLVEAYGLLSTQLVDIKQPEAIKVIAGGQVLPAETRPLRLVISENGPPRPLFIDLSEKEGAARSEVTVLMSSEGQLPVVAGSFLSDDDEARWIGAGDHLYALSTVSGTDLLLRRYPIASIVSARGQQLVPDLEQPLTAELPDGFGEIFSTPVFDVDAGTGDLAFLVTDTDYWALSWFSLGADGYEPVFSHALEQSGYSHCNGIELAHGLGVVGYPKTVAVFDRAGNLLARRDQDDTFHVGQILAFLSSRIYMGNEPEIVVLRADDLDEAARYTLDGCFELDSIAEVGPHLVMSSRDTLWVASPACGDQHIVDPGQPICSANSTWCKDLRTLVRCSADGLTQQEEQREGEFCIGDGQWVRCAAPDDCEAAANPCLDVVCNGGVCDLFLKNAGTPCAGNGSCDDAGHCLGPEGPSCGGSGAVMCQGLSCCRSILVPSGTFGMGRGGRSSSDACPDETICDSILETPEHTATVGAFYLDQFEVTVGRFRRFLEEFYGSSSAYPPLPGSGAHPKLPGSGWQAQWDSRLPATADDVIADLRCMASTQTWTDAPTADGEAVAINCLTWYEAFAFCAWDGGRLPTEAEWEYAAAGGAQNRLYPWGTQPPDETRVNSADNPLSSPFLPVGSFPAGRGRWDHLDLGGGVEEWLLDGFDPDWYAQDGNPCTDCAGGLADPVFRMMRGGSFIWSRWNTRAAHRSMFMPDQGLWYGGGGFRCARDVAP